MRNRFLLFLSPLICDIFVIYQSEWTSTLNISWFSAEAAVFIIVLHAEQGPVELARHLEGSEREHALVSVLKKFSILSPGVTGFEGCDCFH